MATQPGKLMIIQRPDPENSGQWVNLCGFDSTSTQIQNAINSEEKVNCQDRAAVVETTKTYGAQNIVFSGSGIFDDDASGKWAAEQCFAQSKVKLRVFVPGLAYYECDEWLIGNLDFTGEPQGSLNQSMTLEASGTVTPTYLS